MTQIGRTATCVSSYLPLQATVGKASGRAAQGTKRKPPVSGQAQQQGAAPREPELTVLAAITAVRKLCCHPDLVRHSSTADIRSP